MQWKTQVPGKWCSQEEKRSLAGGGPALSLPPEPLLGGNPSPVGLCPTWPQAASLMLRDPSPRQFLLRLLSDACVPSKALCCFVSRKEQTSPLHPGTVPRHALFFSPRAAGGSFPQDPAGQILHPMQRSQGEGLTGAFKISQMSIIHPSEGREFMLQCGWTLRT